MLNEKYFDGAELVVARLKGGEELGKLIEKARNHVQNVEQEILEIAKPHMPNDTCDWEWYVGTFWDCPDSPFGKCMYHRFEDRAHDSCYFCGEPEERK